MRQASLNRFFAVRSEKKAVESPDPPATRSVVESSSTVAKALVPSEADPNPRLAFSVTDPKWIALLDAQFRLPHMRELCLFLRGEFRARHLRFPADLVF
jgi:hypothetical protein